MRLHHITLVLGLLFAGGCSSDGVRSPAVVVRQPLGMEGDSSDKFTQSQPLRTIANSASYGTDGRCACVLELFGKYVPSGTRMKDLAKLVGAVDWLRDDDVSELGFVLGYVPVRVTLDDTIFRIVVFPRSTEGGAVVYVRVQGQIVDRDAFLSALRGRPISSLVGDVAILEVATAWHVGNKRICVYPHEDAT